jgi:light-regulated signal transduction histidine kinase (bacteriophytochrome)
LALEEPGTVSNAPVDATEYSRAILNILEDFRGERDRLDATQRAALNILEDFSSEKERLEQTQRAVLNILDDFSGEKERLEQTQKAVLNILEDFDGEKTKVEAANEGLRREIAERVAAEEALREKSGALARSNAELEQFAYVASHDLQEPLRMVSSYVELLQERYGTQLDANAHKYIDYAVEGATRMQALIAALLEYSRVARKAYEPRPVALERAIERALFNLRVSIQEAGAVIRHDALPAVMADADQLAQLYQNLIGNALKFRRAGVTPEITLGATSDGLYWNLAVQDNGIGIEPRYAERIFAIFQRLHTRTEYPGTGIGLSICKSIVERNGGRIWVESERGKGSTFRFTLPKAAEASA